MSVNISNADRQNIVDVAAKIRDDNGEQINATFEKIYSLVDQMHQYWYGQQFCKWVELYNSMLPSIRNLLDVLIGEIPYDLLTIANRYSQWDTGASITSAYKKEYRNIPDRSLPNDGTNLRFLEEDIISHNNLINDQFNQVINQVNAYKSAYSNVDWASDASAAFLNMIESQVSSINSSLQEIQSELTKLMNETRSTMQSTETGHTV